MKYPYSLSFAFTAVALFTGCETLSERRTHAAQDATELQYLRQDVQRLKTATEEGLEHRHRLDARTERVARDSERQYSAMQQQIDAQQRELEKVRSDNDRMRREIVEEISARVGRMLAAQQAARPPRTSAQSGYEHVVGAGQTLSEIAAAYGVTVDAIVRANDLSDAHRIRVGQKLFIPE